MADDLQSPTEESLAFEGDEDTTTGLDELGSAPDDSIAEDPELEAIKARVKEMEEEAEKLKEMQNQVDKQMMSPKSTGPPSAYPSAEEKAEADGRSIYVGNVDYGATAEELEQHFHGCGSINRVTIMCDKFSGHPKGFAYIEFADKDSIATAVAMDETLFRGRQIKVSAKRTNLPGMARGRGRFRGGGPPRYRMVPSYGGYGGGMYGGYAGYMPRGYGRARFRSRRGTNWYSPY